MEEKNIDLPKKNISGSPDIQKELLAIGGKIQVPCLVINGEPLYESDDIIQWLTENWSNT